MVLPVFLILVSLSPLATAQDQETQRALIQRDQQSAEFGARLRGPDAARRMESLHERQNRELAHPVRPELRAYQRERFSQERQSGAEPKSNPPKSGSDPNSANSGLAPLPLPGGPPRGVDPVTTHGLPY